MAEEQRMKSSKRLAMWKECWDEEDIKFHQHRVNEVLKNQISSLDLKGKTIFVPLCGKTIDMKWLADQGHTVIGLDGVKKSLKDFLKEQSLDYTEKAAPNMGSDCQVLQTTEGNIKLYCGDLMLFNKSLEGQFDIIWDRASLVAMNREDVQRYLEVMDDILCPGGRYILETVEYDVSIMEGVKNTPPPHPMPEEIVKSLFDPKFKVEFLERKEFVIVGKNAHVVYYMMIKKT